jgi:hypothetical protein
MQDLYEHESGEVIQWVRFNKEEGCFFVRTPSGEHKVDAYNGKVDGGICTILLCDAPGIDKVYENNGNWTSLTRSQA